ncbi:MAG: nucleotide exchange factor GrpE [Deltaproteobacteria bacterium]|nr:nucleotide exchange factor GrpE [Deltaproteobacteria bacterium]
MAPDETVPEAAAPAGEVVPAPDAAAPEGSTAPAPEPPPPDPVQLAEERASKAEAERKDFHDRMLRVAADFENFKRRTRKDLEEAEARGRKGLLLAVLPVIDNLERALEAADSTATGAAAASISEGVRLVHKQLLSSLEKFDVKVLPAVGQPFDPNLHEAIQQIETAEQPAGTVVKELQRGYGMGGKLLRPAMVAVAKAPPAAVAAPVAADVEGADASSPGEAEPESALAGEVEPPPGTGGD